MQIQVQDAGGTQFLRVRSQNRFDAGGFGVFASHITYYRPSIRVTARGYRTSFDAMKALAVCWIFAVSVGSVDAQVVVSRRDYAKRGRTFAQIWMADVSGLNFRQLTRSARDHSAPVCSRDGTVIYFISDRDAERSRNAYGGSGGREVWEYDRQTGQERFVWRTSRDLGLDLAGTSADGAVFVRSGDELLRAGRDFWSNAEDAAVSPDGRKVALVISDRLVVADASTGQRRMELGKYNVPAWSPDGARIAAFFEGGLCILDAATGREIERVALPKRDAPGQDIVWSPDGRRLMAGLYGENGGSGDPQSDYFLLDFATRTWTPTLTARRLLWLRDETVLYLRPYATARLSPGSAHSAWTSQVAVYDLTSLKDTPLTSGLVLNDGLAMCDR
jgi:dipeptidyl aminopeptidase/acylaminoacyl peptidase